MTPLFARPGPTISARHAVRDRLRRRTRELAVRAGRGPQQISQLDYEQAKRELTGETDAERQAAVLLALDPFRFPGAAALA